MFHKGCWDDGLRRARWWGAPWGAFEGFGGGPGGGRGRGWRAGGGRVFDQGDLKYVILQLLEEKPRHGYEIIKAIEERFGGAYSPSPGTVYPTLTMLEDMGYTRVTPDDTGKKVHEITDEGRKYLADNKPMVDDIFARITEFAQGLFGEPMMRVHRAFKDLGAAIYVREGKRSPEQIAKISEILERAAAEVRQIT